MAAVLLDLKLFAACDDLWGGPPGPRPTPTSARFWLPLCSAVGQALSPANRFFQRFSALVQKLGVGPADVIGVDLGGVPGTPGF
jgi:hypothetical protein